MSPQREDGGPASALDLLPQDRRWPIWKKMSPRPLAPASYLPDHSEHKDGHVSRLGFDPTLPPTPGGWRTISARGQVAAGSRPAAPERKKGSLQCPPCPDPCIVDVRPNCLLRGHLGPSEFSSGKDVWLCSWQDWSFPDWCLRRALSVRVWPWVSVMSACGPRNDHRFTFYGYNFCSIGNCFYK